MRSLFILFAFSLIAGCGANKYSVFRKYDSADGNNIIIDASQRAILTNSIQYNEYETPDPAKPNEQILKGSRTVSRYCAEPSPDVFTVLSSSFATSGAVTNEGERQQAALNLAQSISQAGATISRTQTIQTLRDILFNECLQWMNDAVSKQSYEMRAARNHRILVSILAIEQLTNAVRPQGVAITASGSASVVSNVETIIRKLDEKRTKLTAAEAKAKEKDDAVTKKTSEAEAAAEAVKKAEAERVALNAPNLSPKPTTEQIAAADTKVTKAKEDQTKADKALETAKGEQKKAAGDVSDLKKAIQALEDALQKPDSVATAGATGVEFADADCCKPDSAVSAEVAKAIRQIVQSNIEFDDFALMCTGLLGRANGKVDATVREFCVEHMKNKKASEALARAETELSRLRIEANIAREQQIIDELFGDLPEE